jgi:hypothetical protein
MQRRYTWEDTAQILVVEVAQGRLLAVRHGPNGDEVDMKVWIGAIAIASGAALVAGSHHANAQASSTFQTTLGNAELAELSPDKRAEVEARMKQPGQNVPEILQTILLNSIKLKHPANRIVALDFGRGVAVVELPSKEMRTVQFDTRTLAIKS